MATSPKPISLRCTSGYHPALWILFAGVLGAAVGFIAIYFYIALKRMGYPYELEWVEGAAVDSVRRVLSGQPLFVQPTIDFAPFMYPPLYFWASAVVAAFTGIGFLPLRLVSFLSSLGCFALIFALVRQETKNSRAGLLACGLFAATYRISGAWFDIARVDSLFLFFVLGALYCLRPPQHMRVWSCLAGAMIFLAFSTKQAALLIFLPLLLANALHERTRTVWCLLTAGALIGTAHFIANSVSPVWYNYYLYELPQGHPFLPHIYWQYWAFDLIRPLPAALGMVLGYVYVVLRRRRKRDYFWVYTILGMTGASYLFRLHSGGYNNVLMPAYAGIAILTGLTMGEVMRWYQSGPQNMLRQLGCSICLLAGLAQFGLLLYNPSEQIPTPADRLAGEKFINDLQAIQGDIFCPWTGYLPALAGKRTKIHMGTINDIIVKGPRNSVREKLIEEISRAIRMKKIAAIVTINGDLKDGQSKFITSFGEDLADTYILSRTFNHDFNFWPRTGAMRQPEYLWVPRKEIP